MRDFIGGVLGVMGPGAFERLLPTILAPGARPGEGKAWWQGRRSYRIVPTRERPRREDFPSRQTFRAAERRWRKGSQVELW